MSSYRKKTRNIVRQAPRRARYDKRFVHSVLDEGFVAHVGFVYQGEPVVIPMFYARLNETLLLHGSRKARVMRCLGEGCRISVAVTHVDGLVLARSAFHHSLNYRSVVVHGCPQVLQGSQKEKAFDALINRFEPGRAELARRANKNEDKATLMLALPLDEVSAKTRSGGPVDDPEDMELDIRAGVVPLQMQRGKLVPDDTGS